MVYVELVQCCRCTESRDGTAWPRACARSFCVYNRSSNIRKITKKVLPPHTKHRTAALHSTAKNFITCCGVATYTVVRIVHGDAPCPNCGSHCKSSMGGSPLFDRARVTSRLQCTGTTAMAAPSALSECGVSVVGSDPLHGADRALDCGPAYAGRVKVCFSTNPAAESLTTLRGQHRFLSSTTWPWLRAPVSVLFDRSRTQ